MRAAELGTPLPMTCSNNNKQGWRLFEILLRPLTTENSQIIDKEVAVPENTGQHQHEAFRPPLARKQGVHHILMSKRNRALPTFPEANSTEDDATENMEEETMNNSATDASARAARAVEEFERRELPPLPNKPRQLRRPTAPRPSPLRKSPSSGWLQREMEEEENASSEAKLNLPKSPKMKETAPGSPGIRQSKSHEAIASLVKQSVENGLMQSASSDNPVARDPDSLDMAEFQKRAILSIVRGRSVIVDLDKVPANRDEKNNDFMFKSVDTVSKESLFESVMQSSNPANDPFLRPFLLVHRQFTDSFELVHFLYKRYMLDSPNATTDRTKVLEILKVWINLNKEDLEDIRIRVLLSTWHCTLINSSRANDTKWADTIRLCWDQPHEESRDLTPTIQRNIGSKESKKVLKLKDHEFTEKIPEFYLACQMTALEFEFYERIDINDLLKKDWHKNTTSLCPARDHFNKMVQWIATEVMSQSHNSQRVTLVNKFVKIADVLMRLNNFNGVMEIYQALTLPAIARLSRLWKKISTEAKSSWSTIESVMKRDSEGKWAVYNSLIRKADGCLIPCLYIVMSEMEEIDKSFSHDDTMFNYNKITALGEIVESFRRHQTIQYNISRDRRVQTFLKEQVRVESSRKLSALSQRYEPAGGVDPSTMRQEAPIESFIWYYGNASRAHTEDILHRCKFSNSHQGHYSLSHCNGERGQVVHTLINPCPGGFYLQGSTGVYKSLAQLVEGCSELYGYKPAWNAAAKTVKLELKLPLPPVEPDSNVYNSILPSVKKATSRVEKFFGTNKYAHVPQSTSSNQLIVRKQNEAEAAIETGNIARLVELIREGLELDNTFKSGQNLYHIAADYNDPRLIEYPHLFHSPKFPPDINGRDDVGWTPLHTACYKSHLRVIEALIECGAEVSKISNSGATPLHYLVRSNHTDEESFTQVLKIVVERGGNVNCQDVNGCTPIWQACATPNIVAVKYLLDAGADPYIPNTKGETVFKLASDLGLKEVLDALQFNSSKSKGNLPGDLLLRNDDAVVEGQTSSKVRNSSHSALRLESDKPPPFSTYFYRKDHLDLIGVDQRDGVIILSYERIPNSTGIYRTLIRTKKGDEILEFHLVPEAIILVNSLRIFVALDMRFIDNLNFSELIHNREEELVSRSITAGLLLVPDGYYTESKYLGDVPQSPAFEEFIRFLGVKIPFKTDMRMYSLEETGEPDDYAIQTKYLGNEVIFNVSTVVPRGTERVDHILNNRMTVVFLEASVVDSTQLFAHDNSSVLVVKPFKRDNVTHYRFVVTRKKGMKHFNPSLEIPSIFAKDNSFRSYLLTKLINGARSIQQGGDRSSLESTRDRILYEIHAQSKSLPTKPPEEWKIEEKYRIDTTKLLGSGATSQAFQAVNRKTKEQVCMKIVDNACLSNELTRKAIEREVTLLRKMDHPHIIKVLDDYHHKGCFYIILELCVGGTLFDDVNQSTTFSEPQAAKVMYQILTAVDHAHSTGISHRDLKPQNILFADKMKRKIKVIDFGYGKDVGEASNLNNTVAGTLDYVAIEMWDGEYDYFKVDIWSCGCIAYFLLFGHTLHSEYKSMNDYHEALKKEDLISKKTNLSPECRTFLKRLLEINPVKRASAQEASEDPWIIKHTH
ncbi:hypothetical protein PROFUN_07211 [Planoprotostelium fungivorum]|uniref:non-specific serine/threonine protein kinase n=1 Tax=Planoprotostelium fungivorum TaxID=1890364 RepID=A0A2P6NMF5_9EUKA|nr:hypothetical protein PROFUN_07211 [Planoprotostelium fungivorum]